ANATNNTQEELIKITPYDYQIKIINDAVKGFEEADRGKLIAACGIGKTLVSKWIVENMESKLILFMDPSLSLIKQTIHEWVDKTNKPFQFLAVCSDNTVLSQEMEDNIITSDLVDFPVTTDPEQVANFFKIKTENPKVIFSTYHSLDIIKLAIMDNDIKFDIGIFDESHRTVGSDDTPLFNLALRDQGIPIKKRLFMTATEKFITDNVKDKLSQKNIEVYSMDDEEIYGKEFSVLNFGQAIEKKIISDYEIIVCAISNKDTLDLLEENASILTDSQGEEEKINIDLLLKKVILAKALNDFDINKIVTYHSNVKRSKEFIDSSSNLSLRNLILTSNEIINNDKLFVDYVSEYMSAGKRNNLLKNFEEKEYGVISNARCLTEGIDVPSIDCVYFVDNRTSKIDIIQAIGRALRKKNNVNKKAKIILPIILDENQKVIESYT